jgi:hypothetical protein
MGADLYIRKLSNECRRKNRRNFLRWTRKRDLAGADLVRMKFCQDKVNLYYDKMYERGYFRDSYNSTSLMWRLGLSWWQDIGKMVDENNNLTVEKAMELREMVASRPLKLIESVAELKANHCDTSGADPVKEWNDYYIKKKQNFLDFLDEAIRLREPIYCSC